MSEGAAPDRDTPEWGPWQRQLRITHLDPSCHRCAFPGPLLECFGLTEVPGWTGRRITVYSRITDGQRPRSVPHHIPAHRVRTHYAVRCPACGDQIVYWISTWEQLDESDVEGPRAPRASSCCEHECAGPHPLVSDVPGRPRND